MEATKYCSLGQLTEAIPLKRDKLFEVGALSTEYVMPIIS